jgi:uncharacterized repeat protein (TIGR03843 family)
VTGPGAAAGPAHALTEGEVVVEGRILPASNATFLGTVGSGPEAVRCVYKPVAGERPLWDFPDGTLARREVAAYVVSEALGWDIVPETVLRDGPAGLGMVQRWQEPDPGQHPVDVVPAGVVPEGYLHVLDAVDADERPVALVHEDSDELRRMALFDAVVNNADRKGGHVLAMTSGHRYGVDHGVTFHVETKLRTVLWGWAGEPVLPEDRPAVARLLETLTTAGDPTTERLGELLAGQELRALVSRCELLLTRGTMPVPTGEWPAVPWPAF